MESNNIRQEDTFQGFTTGEIVNLYKFLYAYEKVESYKSDDIFERDYPKLYETLLSAFKSLDLRTDNRITVIQDANKVRYTDAKRHKYMAFLYHLRNSIAHAYIRKTEQIEIKDLLNREFTASGNVDIDKFEVILNAMISELITN